MTTGAALQIMHDDAKHGWCDVALIDAFVDALPDRAQKKSVA